MALQLLRKVAITNTERFQTSADEDDPLTFFFRDLADAQDAKELSAQNQKK